MVSGSAVRVDRLAGDPVGGAGTCPRWICGEINLEQVELAAQGGDYIGDRRADRLFQVGAFDGVGPADTDPGSQDAALVERADCSSSQR